MVILIPLVEAVLATATEITATEVATSFVGGAIAASKVHDHIHSSDGSSEEHT